MTKHMWIRNSHGGFSNIFGLFKKVGKGRSEVFLAVFSLLLHVGRADGLDHWEPRDFGAITYANNLFVGVSGGIVTSPDGITWTRRYSGSESIHGAAYGNGRWVAVGGTYISGAGVPGSTTVRERAILTSLDGTNWTATSNPGEIKFDTVAFGAGKFIAFGSEPSGPGVFRSVTFSSDDGNNWDQQDARESLPDKDYFTPFGLQVVYGNGLFVAVGGGRWISTDGVTWNHRPDFSGYRVIFGKNRFLAVSRSGKFFVSTDGNALSQTFERASMHHSLGYGDGIFLAADGSAIFSSSDLKTWTRRFTLTGLMFVPHIAHGRNRFMAGRFQSGFTGPRFELENSPRFPDRTVRLKLFGASGERWILESSSDLEVWSTVAESGGVQEPWVITPPLTSANSTLFYRARRLSELQGMAEAVSGNQN